MEQRLSLEETVNKYGLSVEQIFDHAKSGELGFYYEHPELGGPLQVRYYEGENYVLKLKKDGHISFLHGFIWVQDEIPMEGISDETPLEDILDRIPPDKTPLEYILYSPQNSTMYKDQDSFDQGDKIYTKDVYLLESEIMDRLNSFEEKGSQTRESPENIMSRARKSGKSDAEIAAEIDAIWTGSNRLTNEKLGRLLPANPGANIDPASHEKRGKRLRRKTT
jgi:hypothetical protein